MNIDYTLWPNTDGNLGNIKVQIPDGVNTFWPEGDALVGNFVYKDGKLAGFVDAKALTVNESKSTTFPYDYVNVQVDKSLMRDMTFNKGERTKYFTIAPYDFVIINFNTSDQETIDSIRTAKRVVDNKLYDAEGSLIGTIDTSKIEVGGIFNATIMILDGLFCSMDIVTGEDRGIILSEFDSDLSSLRDGSCMFTFCSNLTSFNSDLSSLTNGCYMFIECSALTSFTSGLPSLTNGTQMFESCKLDTVSIQNIADTIKNVSSLTNSSSPMGEVWKEIWIGIGNSTPNEDEIAAFDTIASRGWTVYVNGSNYTPSTAASIMTLDENGEEVSTPIPFYAKPVPATEKTASYVDANGNFFNIVGAQFVYGDDLSTYGMFTCEEDAAFNMGLTKIEKEKQVPSLPAFFNN